MRLDRFSPGIYGSQSHRDAIERVIMSADDDLSALECGIDVKLKDGSRLSAETGVPKGHPQNPLTWTELEAKTLDVRSDRFDVGVLVALVSRVRSLEQETSVNDLLALTRP